jgi:hypothetical protein
MATPEQVAELKTVADALTEKEDEIRTRLINLEEANETLLGNIDTAKEAATRATDPAQVAALNRRAADLQTQLDQGLAQEKQLTTQLKEVAQQANQARTRARVAEEQQAAAAEPKPEPQSPATASQTAQDDAAKGPNAPPPATVGADGRVVAPATTAPTNATPTLTSNTPGGAETDTNPPVKTQEQTQSINTGSNSGQPPVAPPTNQSAAETARLNATNPAATTKPGAAGAKDDAARPQTLQNTVDAGDNDDVKIVPRSNVLDEYYSYSYSASVYLLTQSQYTKLLVSKDKTVDGYYLLFQSGGAPSNVGGTRQPPTPAVTPARNSRDQQRQASERQSGVTGTGPTAVSPPGPDGGRNPFFPDDYYIDSISLTSILGGKGTGSATKSSELKFTVVEPNGITLLDNLQQAVKNIAPTDGSGKVNYTAATYLMVIRFYGYDQDGNLEKVTAKVDPEGTSDRTAVVEKFIPFKIGMLNWSVGSKMVSYEWECIPGSEIIAGSTARGTIPYDVQLVNSTVGGLLSNRRVTVANSSGDENQNESNKFLRQQAAAQAAPAQADLNRNERATRNYNNSNEFAGMQEQNTSPAATSAPAAAKPAPAKANSAPTNKVVAGLMAAMNEFQQKLVKDGIYTTADVYSIEFVGPNAKAISGAKLQLPNAKVDKKQTASGASPAKEGGAALDAKRQSVDLISRSFSITAGQQLLQVIEQVIRNSSYITDQALVVLNPDGTYTANPKAKPDKPMKWFEISMTATPLGDKMDPLRNDYAYNIKYVVRQKILSNFDSKYFPVSTFTGVHKSYPYWFTGQNTAVLEYQETLNALYHVTVSGSPKFSEDKKDREQYTSSLADIRKYSYSPRSNASSQGGDGKVYELGANAAEVIYSPGDLAEAKVKIIGDPAWIQQGSLFRDAEQVISTPNGFDPDGSISFDTSTPMFEIVWQRPQDYDIDTGLADPYSKQPGEFKRTAQQSRVYVCKEVVSEFNRGSFTQTLNGILYTFPIPSKDADKAKVKQTDAKRRNPNITRDVERRTGVNLSDKAGSDARNAYAASDPRLTTGGRAQVAGAQRAAGVPAPGFGETAGGAATGNPKIAAQGRYGGATQVLPAGQPRPPTSNESPAESSRLRNAGITATPTSTGAAPQRLPPSPTAVTPANVAAARQGASRQSPNSPTQPQNQPIVKTT